MLEQTPKQRVFEMLASVARILDESTDLNAERHHLATLVEHCRSWESQVADLPAATHVDDTRQRYDELLVRDLRSVAADAARCWAQALCEAQIQQEAEAFGASVAQVFLSALRTLSAGSAPDAGSPGERV